MAIKNKASAVYPSLQAFISSATSKDNSPSLTNLWSLHFTTPKILRPSGAVSGGNLQAEVGEMHTLLDYFADTVNLPSKQVTTGSFRSVGSAVRYATASTFSQFSVNFKVPASQKTRIFFERWISLMANDANQYTDYFKHYTAPEVYVFKWERGGGDPLFDANFVGPLTAAQQLAFDTYAGTSAANLRKHRITSCWQMQNVFPFNIGSIQLDNANSKIMTLPITFYYERYRFFGEDRFDEQQDGYTITLPAGLDDISADYTSNNITVQGIQTSVINTLVSSIINFLF
mgnify:CR=1 FL=1